MVRYMVDSTDCTQFPSSITLPGKGQCAVSLFAGYRGGSYEKSSHACGNVNVDIDVDGTHPTADILDIEKGDATPDTAPGWVVAHNKVSSFPGILYCNTSTITAVANYLAAAGLQVNKDYMWFIAKLNGVEKVPDMTGVVAVQAYSANFFPGRNIDVSVVYDDSWKGGTPDMSMSLTDRISVRGGTATVSVEEALGRAYDVYDALFNGGDSTPGKQSLVTVLGDILAAVEATGLAGQVATEVVAQLGNGIKLVVTTNNTP